MLLELYIVFMAGEVSNLYIAKIFLWIKLKTSWNRTDGLFYSEDKYFWVSVSLLIMLIGYSWHHSDSPWEWQDTMCGYEVPGKILLQAYLNLTAYWEGSPSKYFLSAAMDLTQRCCCCWKHFSNSCCGRAFNATVTLDIFSIVKYSSL
jgi:hypothetical protein